MIPREVVCHSPYNFVADGWGNPCVSTHSFSNRCVGECLSHVLFGLFYIPN